MQDLTNITGRRDNPYGSGSSSVRLKEELIETDKQEVSCRIGSYINCPNIESEKKAIKN